MKYIKTFFRLLLGLFPARPYFPRTLEHRRLATAEGMVAVVLQKEIADIEYGKAHDWVIRTGRSGIAAIGHHSYISSI